MAEHMAAEAGLEIAQAEGLPAKTWKHSGRCRTSRSSWWATASTTPLLGCSRCSYRHGCARFHRGRRVCRRRHHSRRFGEGGPQSAGRRTVGVALESIWIGMALITVSDDP